MGAFTNLDTFVNLMTGGNSGAPENLLFSKLQSVGGALASFGFSQAAYSLWRFDGIPNGGAVAAAVANPDKTTTGALQFTNGAGGATKLIVQGFTESLTDSNQPLWVMDRLLACGGLSGTVTTAQTVGGSLTRYTGGEGNQIWVEIQSAIGGTATTITASYTNSAGTSGRTTIPRRFGGSSNNEAHNAMQLPLQAGDTGVQSVQTVTVLASTALAGDFAVIIYHPLTLLCGLVPQGPFGQLGGLPEIVDDACITFIALQSSTSQNCGGMLCTVDV